MPGRRWRVVVGAVLIQFSLGAIYAWSVFTPALRDAGWSRVETQVVFSVGLASFALVMVLAGKKLTVWGPRRLAIASGVTLGAGYLLAALGGGTGFWPVLIGVGLVGGAGIGVGYVVPDSGWACVGFPTGKGMITGVAVAGFGFGALGWIKLAGGWGDLIARFGLDGTFAIYGVIFASLVLLGSAWMTFPPEGWLPDGFVAPGGRRLRHHQLHVEGDAENPPVPPHLTYLRGECRSRADGYRLDEAVSGRSFDDGRDVLC